MNIQELIKITDEILAEIAKGDIAPNASFLKALSERLKLSDAELKKFIEEMTNLQGKGNDEILKKKLHAVPGFSEYGFDFNIYRQLLPYAKLAYLLEKNGTPENNAYRLAVLFNNKTKALNYVAEFAKDPNVSKPFHDACNEFALPPSGWNLDIWRKLIEKYSLNHDFQKLFGRAVAIEKIVPVKQAIKKEALAVLKEDKIVLLEESIKKLSTDPTNGKEVAHLNEVLQMAKELKALEKFKQDTKPEIKKIKDEIQSINDKIQALTPKPATAAVAGKEQEEMWQLTAKIKELQKGLAKKPKEDQEKIHNEIERLQNSIKSLREKLKSKPRPEAPTVAAPALPPEELERLKSPLLKQLLPLQKKLRGLNKKLSDEVKKFKFQFTENTSVYELKQLAASLSYKNAWKNLEAAQLFAKYYLDEKLFDEYLSLKLVPKEADKFIPQMTIKGEDLGIPKYYITRLDRNDPRGAILGELTACCQSLRGAGADCVKHGLTSPYGGFYVLCKGDGKNPKRTDTVYAQCWAWRSEKGNLVFDSIESQPVFLNSEQGPHIIKQLFGSLAYELVSKEHAKLVKTGVGGNTPDDFGFPNTIFLPKKEYPLKTAFKRYKGYRDSEGLLRLLANSKNPMLSLIYLGRIKEFSELVAKNVDEITSNSKALRLAVSIGNVEMVKLILRIFENIKNIFLITSDKKYRELLQVLKSGDPNVLLLAAEAGSIDMLECFRNVRGLHFDITDEFGATMLHYAARSNKVKVEVIQYLLKMGLDPNQVDKEGYTALRSAAAANKWEIVQFWLNQIKAFKIEDPSDKELLEVLDFAVSDSQWEVVQYFLNEIKNNRIQKPSADSRLKLLYYASKEGKLDIIKLIMQTQHYISHDQDLTHDLDLNKTLKLPLLGGLMNDTINDTILNTAINRKQWQVVDYLLLESGKKIDLNKENRDGKSVMMLLAENGRTETIFSLLKYRKDINLKKVDHQGNTLLHLAAKGGSLELVKFLVEQQGLDINQGDKLGQTMIEDALNSDNWNIVQYLLDRKELKLHPSVRERIILRASKVDEWNIVKSLLMPEPNLKWEFYGDRSLLILAIEKEKLEIVQYLLQHGVDTRFTRTEDERTILHVAVLNGNTDVIKCILTEAKDLDINKLDKDGKKALDYAAEKPEIQKLFKEYEDAKKLKEEFPAYLLHQRLLDEKEKEKSPTPTGSPKPEAPK